jgi:putative transposase
MVKQPEQHPWSSYHANALGTTDKLITPHALYTGLGTNTLERQAAHRAMCGEQLSQIELASIRNALRTGRSGAKVMESAALAAAS